MEGRKYKYVHCQNKFDPTRILRLAQLILYIDDFMDFRRLWRRQFEEKQQDVTSQQQQQPQQPNYLTRIPLSHFYFGQSNPFFRSYFGNPKKSHQLQIFEFSIFI